VLNLVQKRILRAQRKLSIAEGYLCRVVDFHAVLEEPSLVQIFHQHGNRNRNNLPSGDLANVVETPESRRPQRDVPLLSRHEQVGTVPYNNL
jgi:hypothetical protein